MESRGAVTLRSILTDADLATWVATYNRASPCRREGVAYTRHAWSVADEWSAFIAERDGRPVGAAHVEIDVWSPGSCNGSGMVVVPPEERRRGVGSLLAARLSEWTRERGRVGLDVWCDVASADAMGFWSGRGFVEVSRERLSHLDLAIAEVTPPELPPDVTVISLGDRTDLEEGMYRVGAESVEDIPGADPYDAGDFAQWRHGELGWPDLLRDCSVVALVGDEVIGFSTLVAFTERPGLAEHEMTAVARGWRGRGLATAMKRQIIANARAAGLTTLEAMNEERNAPMLTVNERLGYRPVTAWVQLRGPLLG